MKGKNFFEKLFTIDEARISAVIFIFLISSFFSLVMYALDRDISRNLLDFLFALLTVVGGVNIAGSIRNIFTKRNMNNVGDNESMNQEDNR